MVRAILVVAPAGVEPAARGLGNRCSIRLSYGATKTYEMLVVLLVALSPIFNRSAITVSSVSLA